MNESRLFGRLLLRFNSKGEAIPEELSAAVRSPEGHLWVAADEHGYVERLSIEEPRIYGEHKRFKLKDHLELQAAEDGTTEIDIEAVDFADGHLWVVGSHSSKRKKPKGHSRGDDLDRLAEIKVEPSRFLLGRVPLKDGGLGAKAKSAKLRHTKSGGSLLLELLANDEHLGPFSAIPGKDNGVDVEGMAVVGDRVLLGLRGPVLRGYAVVLELQLTVKGGELEPRADKKGRLFRKHFVDLDGLGIRELCARGDDLLILAGPTMSLEGPQRLFVLPDGMPSGQDSVHKQETKGLRRILDIPATDGETAEGVALFSWFEEDDSVLVLFDGPSPQRRYKKTGVFADVFMIDAD